MAFWNENTPAIPTCQSRRFEIDIESKWVYSHIKLSSYFRYVLFQVITQFDMKKLFVLQTNTHNRLIINNMRNHFQYSHICRPLSIW